MISGLAVVSRNMATLQQPLQCTHTHTQSAIYASCLGVCYSFCADSNWIAFGIVEGGGESPRQEFLEGADEVRRIALGHPSISGPKSDFNTVRRTIFNEWKLNFSNQNRFRLHFFRILNNNSSNIHRNIYYLKLCKLLSIIYVLRTATVVNETTNNDKWSINYCTLYSIY